MKKALKFFTLVAAASMMVAACTKAPKTVTLDFEGSNWDALIDNPQYGGALLYGTYNEAAYSWNVAQNYTWADGNTTLGFTGFPESWGSLCFSNGGEAISNYVNEDYTGADYTRQLEIPVAPKSGKNFVVHYGYTDPTAISKDISLAPAYAKLQFADNVARTIKSIDVCPTSYLLNSCVNGDSFFGPLTGDSAISLKAIGFDATGVAKITSTVKFIDGADAAAYKAGTKKPGWAKWDLSDLGEVAGVMFCVIGTDDCYGDYGFNAPAYFAYDNIVVEMPAE